MVAAGIQHLSSIQSTHPVKAAILAGRTCSTTDIQISQATYKATPHIQALGQAATTDTGAIR